MSNYLDEKNLFMTPDVTQYGSHMIMTNVQKQTRKKYVNLDTRFRDDFQTSNIINYNITLPERINEVRAIAISNVELPMTFYNISSNLGNNTFSITIQTINTIIVIPDGNYDISGISAIINTQIMNSGITTLQFSIKNRCSVFTNTSMQPALIDFSVNSKGESNSSTLKFKLGGVLGFTYSQYILGLNNLVLTSGGVINLNTIRYVYIIIDDFSGKGNQSGLSTYLQNSSLGKNVLGRIQIDNTTYPYGSTLIANKGAGLLTADVRNYNGKIDLQRFNIQLVNETGVILDLNGQDLSLCLIAEYE
jgi:hypothetical protein